jgi:hypothetical protein
MLAEPQVSVIVPVYNSAGSVAASLQSLFQQTLRELEVIAVNDASSDGSGAILDELAAGEPRLKVIHLLQNGGVHEARASGLRAATAGWIGFLDADDFAEPGMFAALYRAGVDDRADVVICGSDQVEPGGKAVGAKVAFSADMLFEDAIVERFCRWEFGMGALWNKLYRRELIMGAGVQSFRWRQDEGEDLLVNIGCFLHARRVSLLRARLHRYVIHSSRSQSVRPVQGYCQLMGAYALAVDAYCHHGNAALDAITDLYSLQLGFECYQVTCWDELAKNASAFQDAFQLLATKHPLGLARLINGARVDPAPEGFRGIAIRGAKDLASLPRLFFDALVRRCRMASCRPD